LRVFFHCGGSHTRERKREGGREEERERERERESESEQASEREGESGRESEGERNLTLAVPDPIGNFDERLCLWTREIVGH